MKNSIFSKFAGKAIALLGSAAMVFSVSACGQSNDTSAQTD